MAKKKDEELIDAPVSAELITENQSSGVVVISTNQIQQTLGKHIGAVTYPNGSGVDKAAAAAHFSKPENMEEINNALALADEWLSKHNPDPNAKAWDINNRAALAIESRAKNMRQLLKKYAPKA
jgi:hypothetical protein